MVVPLSWPGITSVKSDLPESVQKQIKSMLDEVGDQVHHGLSAVGLAAHTSPLFRPFSLTVVKDDAHVLVGFSSAVGIPDQTWVGQPGNVYAPQAMVQLLRDQMGKDVLAVLVLPHPEAANRSAALSQAAALHVGEVERANAMSRLGDTQHVQHLERYLRAFLADHPAHDRNVFVMMRFNDTLQMKQVFASIKSALASRGMTAIRADDRDYTGELWSNIEVYLTGCKYGIAVFEDIEQRDYNPNVSLELGYLMGRGKRTLLLKEKRLPRLPTDVVHRLYKEFDIFDIEGSIERELGRWVDVDLGIGRT